MRASPASFPGNLDHVHSEMNLYLQYPESRSKLRQQSSLREFGLCTLPSSEPRTSARSKTWSGSALPKVLTSPNLLKCYVFQDFYPIGCASARFFIKSLKRRAPTAAARLVCVELVASETPERRRSTFLKMYVFPPMRISITVALVFHWLLFR